MIKAIQIGEKGGLTTIHIDCDLQKTGIQSIDVVCEPGKAKEAQEFVFKIMQILSLPKTAVGAVGELFKARAR